MAKKPAIDPEILKLRASQRASARREANKVAEQHRVDVLSMYYNANKEPKVQSLDEASGKSHVPPEVLNALSYVIGQRAQKVLTTFDINPRIRLRTSSGSIDTVRAQTDFTDIEVVVPVKNVKLNDEQSVAQLLAAVKGVLYHEGGHIVCTMPFNQLFDCALMDNNLAPVNPYVSNWSGVINAIKVQELYPAYFDEFASGQFNPDYTLLFPDQLKLITDEERTNPGRAERLKKTFSTERHYETYCKLRDDLFPAWVLLEDGRMESEMVHINGEMMEHYFTCLTLEFLIPEEMPGYAWPAIASRTYLNDELRDLVKQAAYMYTMQANIDPNLVEEIEQGVRKFRQSTNATDVIHAVFEMKCLLDRWKATGNHKKDPGEGPNESPENSGGNTVRVTEKPKFGDEGKGWEPSDDKEQGNGNPDKGEGQPKSEGKDTDKDGQNTKEDGKRSNNYSDGDDPCKGSSSSGSGGSIEHKNHEELREKMRKMLNEAKNNVSSLDEAKDLIAEVNQELKKDIPHNSAITPLSNELTEKARAVQNSMLTVLEPLAVTADPAWRFRQENGVLDPTGYKMHEPGDTDYWSSYEGEGAHGHDLAVSILLDTSASMDAWMDELSVAAFGIRSACDSLGIPCTVTTFDTSPALIWNHDEDAVPVMIHDGGGTDPTEALKQVRNQRANKLRHLVVVMTDGQWSGVNSVKPFAQPGEYWVAVGLSTDRDYGVSLVSRKGADSYCGITEVLELPQEVGKALMGFLS